MKKTQLLFLAAALFLVLSQATAQRDRNSATRNVEMKQKLITDLKLTDVQADSVMSINQSTMPQRRSLFEDQSLSREDKRARMMAMTDSSDSRIKAVLGDSLFVRYKDWRKANRPARMGGGQPGADN